jgi:hypothetical protein
LLGLLAYLLGLGNCFFGQDARADGVPRLQRTAGARDDTVAGLQSLQHLRLDIGSCANPHLPGLNRIGTRRGTFL